MSGYIEEYEFKTPPKEITYYDDKPLELNQELTFYHNKTQFRKELTRLQYLFKKYLKNTLLASGIRDSYLKKEYSEEYFIVLFADINLVKEINQIVEKHSEKEILPRCFFLESNSNYMVLLSKDIEGLTLGIDEMESIFTQTFEDYLNRKQFDDYIKIRQFKMISCKK